MESPIPPPSVFVDSSVLFAASYSATGSAYDLLLVASQGRIALVLSDYVLSETERSLPASVPHAHATFRLFRDNFPYQLSHPPQSFVVESARVVVAKDAPIIAAARFVGAAFIATYDRKHLLSKREQILNAFGIRVARPDEILASLEADW